MFFIKDVKFVPYVDHGIVFKKDATKFDWIFTPFHKECEVERQVNVQQFLGMQFTKLGNEVTITQSHLIEQIIKDIGLGDIQCKCPDITMKSSQILQQK